MIGAKAVRDAVPVTPFPAPEKLCCCCCSFAGVPPVGGTLTARGSLRLLITRSDSARISDEIVESFLSVLDLTSEISALRDCKFRSGSRPPSAPAPDTAAASVSPSPAVICRARVANSKGRDMQPRNHQSNQRKSCFLRLTP